MNSSRVLLSALTLAFLEIPIVSHAEEPKLWQAPLIEIRNHSSSISMLEVTYSDPGLVPTSVEILSGGRVIVRAKTFQKIDRITLNGEALPRPEVQVHYNATVSADGTIACASKPFVEADVDGYYQQMDDFNRGRPELPRIAKNWATDLPFVREKNLRRIKLSGGWLFYAR